MMRAWRALQARLYVARRRAEIVRRSYERSYTSPWTVK